MKVNEIYNSKDQYVGPEICDRCRGTGQGKVVDSICGVCKGSGVVTAKPEEQS